MIRARRLVTLLPAMIAGGILFGAAFGHASSGDDRAPGGDPDADAGADADFVRHAPARRTADGGRSRPLPPLPPAPPVPPTPPAPPTPPGGWGQPPTPGHGGFGGRFSITVRNGKVHMEGLEDFVRQHLDAAREAIRNNPSIPPDARDRALARLDRARAVAQRRLANLDTSDLDNLGDEMEKVGDEIEKAMEGLDDDMEKLGEKLGKDLAKELSKNLGKGFGPKIRIERHRGRDDADDGDDGDDADGGDHGRAAVMAPDVDVNVRGSIPGLPDLTLRPAQRAQIGKLRGSYEQRIAVARKQLDDASERLRVALEDPRTSDAEISRCVDQVSAYEAEIRKARLLTWVGARRLLDESQRKQIEDAAARKRHR
jgi:Spy/CpxP family protein refolding chaperone